MVIKIAHYYPGFHSSPDFYQGLKDGWCEWELLKAAKPFFVGHYQPRVPLWGYEDETLPEVMERNLITAHKYGIDSLMFLTYWYQGHAMCYKPLEVALKVAKEGAARPCMMWANHNRYFTYPEYGDQVPHTYLTVDYSWENCKKMMDYWIENYFSHPGYYKLPDGCLFFTVYAPQTIVKTTGSDMLIARMIEYLRKNLQKHSLPNIHIHGCETRFVENFNVLKLGFDSCSDYLSLGYSESPPPKKEPCLKICSLYGRETVDIPLEIRLDRILDTYLQLQLLSPIEYFPVVTVGRDCSPRIYAPTKIRIGHYSARPILHDFHPEIFRKHCLLAKQFLERKSTSLKMVFFNAWNEWTEGAYLQPDTLYQWQFLEVIRQEFGNNATCELF